MWMYNIESIEIPMNRDKERGAPTIVEFHANNVKVFDLVEGMTNLADKTYKMVVIEVLPEDHIKAVIVNDKTG